jgi:hypothetical protein
MTEKFQKDKKRVNQKLEVIAQNNYSYLKDSMFRDEAYL